MLVVIDTNVINYYLKNSLEWGKYNKLLNENRVASFVDWVLCFATIQELFSWSITQPKYDEPINEFIKSCRIAPMTLSCCKTAAKIRHYYMGEARWHDVWIAATAVDYNIPLVTNNPNDFNRLIEKSNLKVYSAK